LKMKKNFILTFCLLLVCFVSFAGKLVLINVNEVNNLETLFKNNELKIHYYCDDYVIATTENITDEGAVILDDHAFTEGKQYVVVYCNETDKSDYLKQMNHSAKWLYSGNNFLIMQILSNDFKPYKNDGMIAIRDMQARLPKSVIAYPVITETDEEVFDYISQVSIDNMMADIQTLQDFETRNCLHPNIDIARDWIKAKYESFGLEVSLHHFNFNISNNVLDGYNVIAIQRGTEFPDEYVVCGAHYDSFTFESLDIAPGADDNATGTAGILETARILSQYDFKRSIIYCSFSAEEYGLLGSNYYAEQCASQGMNIVGYFNLDMTGYLTEGDDIHLFLIYTNLASSLANYFVNVSDVYFPEVPVERYLNHPYSDHASFNNVGYQGIWWFEDIFCICPYIHHIPGGSGCRNHCTGDIPCLGDIIGPGVNNPEQVKIFTQINVACVTTLAMYAQAMPPPLLAPPVNCKAAPINSNYIKVTWEAPIENPPTKYRIYKDGNFIQQVEATQLQYITRVNDQSEHCYTVTAMYGIFESDFSNESCASIGITEYDSKIKLYPNPANNELQVMSYELQVMSIEIYDVYGRKLSHISHPPPIFASGGKSQISSQIDISDLQAGIYFVKVTTENEIVIQKVVKM